MTLPFHVNVETSDNEMIATKILTFFLIVEISMSSFVFAVVTLFINEM